MNEISSPSVPPLEVGGEVINMELSGYLFKRRGGYGKLTFNPWQLRYFKIKNGFLSYYESQESPESEARGNFDLREEFEMLGGPCSIEGSPNSFTIQLFIPNEEKWKLCAENNLALRTGASASVPAQDVPCDPQGNTPSELPRPHLRRCGVPVSCHR